MPNSFGALFTITTWGESHGPAIGVVIDGCPPGLAISPEEVQVELDRRRPGQSSIVTPRKESDSVEFLSGVFEGKTTGTPISMLVRNSDQRPGAYDEMKNKYRPSHADYTYQAKFGLRDHPGWRGRRSSPGDGRPCCGRGQSPKSSFQTYLKVEIRAFVTQVQDIRVPDGAITSFPTLEEVESNPIRCPHPNTAVEMIERIEAVRKDGDSVGGLIQCRIRGVPAGLGEPVFDRLEADLAKAMLSLPATKGL